MVWFDLALGGCATPGCVAEPQPLLVPACLGDRGEHPCCDDRPGRGTGDGHRAQGVHPGPEPGRQDPHHLGEPAQGRILHPRDPALRRVADAHREATGCCRSWEARPPWSPVGRCAVMGVALRCSTPPGPVLLRVERVGSEGDGHPRHGTLTEAVPHGLQAVALLGEAECRHHDHVRAVRHRDEVGTAARAKASAQGRPGRVPRRLPAAAGPDQRLPRNPAHDIAGEPDNRVQCSQEHRCGSSGTPVTSYAMSPHWQRPVHRSGAVVDSVTATSPST